MKCHIKLVALLFSLLHEVGGNEVEFALEFSPLIEQQSDDVGEPTRFERSVGKALNTEWRTVCHQEGYGPPPNRVDTSERILLLRERMKANNFDAIIIPSSDEHQNEYVAPSDKRILFISGFSGSAGVVVVTRETQILWTDSRYTLQADQQLDCNWQLTKDSTPAKWLAHNLPEGSIVAADPRLFGAKQWAKNEQNLNESGIALVSSGNVSDEVWKHFGRPSEINGSIFIHDLKYAGKSWEQKVKSVRDTMEEEKTDLFIVTALDEIAWLFNLRGSDIPYSPVFKSYAVIEANSSRPVHLFIRNPDTLSVEVKEYLAFGKCSPNKECVNLYPYEEIERFLDTTQQDDICRVLLSSPHPFNRGVSQYISSSIPEHKRHVSKSPILLLKSRKNPVEIAGMREAQIKDSVALIEFLAFLEDEISKGSNWNEISAMGPLRQFREEQENFVGDSFEPISAFGSNAAIVHYVPVEETKALITNRSLYLLDSGGHYLDGTTDITRTMHFGTPTPFQIEAYTRVLKGFVDLATFVFPNSTKDIFLDILARRSLYDAGLDYGHGTGHGIGLLLNIHEGPTLLSMREKMVSRIEEGQFFSDEPGYYKDGEFGIRLESILQVVHHPSLVDSTQKVMLQLETVTLVPFESNLIDFKLLDKKQCQFLNYYNGRIRDIVGQRLQKKGNNQAYEWMTIRTRPIECMDWTLEAF